MRSIAALIITSILLAAPVMAQSDEPVAEREDVEGHVYKPAAVEPTPDRLARLQMPDGFRIDVFADNLENPRMIDVAPDGTVYVSRPQQGDVLMLRDTNGDGRADEWEEALRQPHAHGIAVHENRMYVAAVESVFVGNVADDGTVGELQPIITGLPNAGQHPNRTLRVGSDGMLYVTVGSLANAVPTPETDKSAAMLRSGLDGRELTVFAEGLRNTLGFGWHPTTGAMWAMDHGTDWLGDDRPPEELNRIIEGANYGWPYVWGDGNDIPQTDSPPEMTWEEFAEMSTSHVLGYTPHSAPMQLAFYTGTAFPAEYRNDAFVAMRGSWNRLPPSGYEVIRIRFDESGEPTAIESFLSGFLIERPDGTHEHFARLAGLAQTPDGALLLGDDANGVIYRITYDE